MIALQKNPIAIKLRQQRINIIDKAMESDPLTRIQYTAKAKGISNTWKKMIGESRGIKRIEGIEQKQAFEQDFEKWVQSDPAIKARYGELLPAFGKSYGAFVPINNAYTYLTEGLLGIEVVRFAYGYDNLVKQCKDKSKSDDEILKLIDQLKTSASTFHKNYSKKVDMQLFEAMISTYIRLCDAGLQATGAMIFIKRPFLPIPLISIHCLRGLNVAISAKLKKILRICWHQEFTVIGKINLFPL